MKQGIISDTTKSAKQLAQDIAQKMAREPLEILKDAKEQITGEELSRQPDSQQLGGSDEQKKLIEQQGQFNDQLKSGRRMEALQREIDDIRKQEVFKDLQRRISEGEEIALEEYPELSIEQKQVLNAQMEAVRMSRRQDDQASGQLEVPSVHSKPSRKFGAGQKSQAQKEQTRVEKPVPPSG